MLLPALLLFYSTPLHWAAHHDDIAAARKLLREGADVNAATDLGVTPLWSAALNGNAELVRLLLEAGANPNLTLTAGETPLMAAAQSGYAEVVSLLLSRGADPNARGTRKQTALMWAVSQRHPDVVKALLASGKVDVRARSESWTQMMAVPPHGYPPYNKQIPHGNYTALLFAARSGDLESAKLLVAAGADVNDCDAWGVSATTLAAHSGFRDLVLFLLGKGADPNLDKAGFNALHIAIMRRDEAMAAALLDHGANPNAPLRTWTPTRRSSKDYHFQPELVGATPFWLAARFTQPAVMRLLAEKGADAKFVHASEFVAGKNYQVRVEKTTALLAALGLGGGAAWVAAPADGRDAVTLEAVRVVVSLGADINAAAGNGRTALAEAQARGLDRVVQLLVEAGAR